VIRARVMTRIGAIVNEKYSDKVYFVSKKTLEEAKQFYPEFAQKFYHQPNEIDKSKFYKLKNKEKEKIKKELGFDDGKKNILFVGRLEPLKGILLLIKVIKEINNPNIILIIVGDGPLKNKIQKYSFVKYLGKIPNEELYKYYNTVDLFVLPSLYENSPMTILEAKACGCKILASDVGDNKYNLSEKEIYYNNIELREKLR
jgi:glycosyltransferase involved in cell wall biosynthesis